MDKKIIKAIKGLLTITLVLFMTNTGIMKKLFLLSFAILTSYLSVGQICGTSTPFQVTIYPEEPSNARGAYLRSACSKNTRLH